MSWLVTAICVIVLPGLASLFLVLRYGPWPGIVILSALLVWAAATYLDAEASRNIPIQPEIFGGQTIGHAQVGGLGGFLWAVFVLGPASLWAALALAIGFFAGRGKREGKAQP
ncbi:hypothetical protein A8B78_19615 [Jannaschia sp. EhC01]|nr:hypothetical protein A8B78_19615 [Jannaschia sp. EhC01]